jgi:hypothetical protein
MTQHEVFLKEAAAKPISHRDFMDSIADENSYKVGRDWGKAAKDFYDAFGIGIKHFYDGELTLLFWRIKINPFAFDEWLYKEHKDYKDYIEGKSMNDIVLEKYGEKALEILGRLL